MTENIHMEKYGTVCIRMNVLYSVCWKNFIVHSILIFFSSRLPVRLVR